MLVLFSIIIIIYKSVDKNFCFKRLFWPHNQRGDSSSFRLGNQEINNANFFKHLGIISHPLCCIRLALGRFSRLEDKFFFVKGWAECNIQAVHCDVWLTRTPGCWPTNLVHNNCSRFWHLKLVMLQPKIGNLFIDMKEWLVALQVLVTTFHVQLSGCIGLLSLASEIIDVWINSSASSRMEPSWL